MEGVMSTSTTFPTGGHVVQELPWRWKVQGNIFLIGGLGFMFDAWDVTLNGYLIPLLSREWHLDAGGAAWVGTSNLIGMAVGAFAWGSIADIVGRRKAFTLTLLIFSLPLLGGNFLQSLNGTVNPNALSVTTCQFDYGTGADYGSSADATRAVVSSRR